MSEKEPTIEQHLTAVRESLQEAIGEKGCIVEIVPARNKPTMAKLRCRRFLDENENKMIEIVKLSGFMGEADLPIEYLEGTPLLALIVDPVGEYVRVYDGYSSHSLLKAGDKITYKRYGQLMRIMKEAGQRLTDINAQRKKEMEFSGEFEVTI